MIFTHWFSIIYSAFRWKHNHFIHTYVRSHLIFLCEISHSTDLDLARKKAITITHYLSIGIVNSRIQMPTISLKIPQKKSNSIEVVSVQKRRQYDENKLKNCQKQARKFNQLRSRIYYYFDSDVNIQIHPKIQWYGRRHHDNIVVFGWFATYIIHTCIFMWRLNSIHVRTIYICIFACTCDMRNLRIHQLLRETISVLCKTG